MSKKKDLLSFLFFESADAESGRGKLDIAENLDQLFETVAELEKGELESKKTPLAKALGEFGISDTDLQLDPEGFLIVTDNHQAYTDMMTVLGSADAMHKLAEMGWVVTKPGDVAMTNEPAQYHIRFLEITTVDQNDREPKPGYDDKNREEVIKKAQEFATTPMDRKDDDLNPVEQEDGKMGKKDAGVGKAKDGEEPEKSIHDALARGDIDAVLEMTTTASMGTAMSQGAPGAGLVKKPAPYGKGTAFKTPSQWTVKQPVVKTQVKRKVRSEATEEDEAAAEAFLREAAPGENALNHGEPEEPAGDELSDEEAYQDAMSELESGECVVFNDRRANSPTQVMFGRELLGTIPGTFEDIDQALAAVNAKMEEEGYFPNIYHVNDHGNVSLWDGQGNTIRGWV